MSLGVPACFTTQAGKHGNFFRLLHGSAWPGHQYGMSSILAKEENGGIVVGILVRLFPWQNLYL